MADKKIKIIHSFYRTNITVKLALFVFAFQITAFNCWYFCFALHISLSVCECIGTVSMKLFKGCHHLNFCFEEIEKIKRERRTEGIRSSACPAVREPGGSAGGKTTLSSELSSERWLVAGFPVPWPSGLQGTLFFFHSKHKLFPRTMHYGRVLHAAHMQGMRKNA